MADWRQIQARIRKAKASSDPAEQLAELYERTRDAMVAFELARWQEKAADNAEAIKWYTAAAERFRRASWRVKAEEALTRLGAPIPAPMTAEQVAAGDSAAAQADASSLSAESKPQEIPAKIAEDVSSEEQEETGEVAGPLPLEPAPEQIAATGASASPGAATPGKKHRRRGRRGGRNRRRDGQAGQPGAAAAGTSAGTPAGVGNMGRREPARQFSSPSQFSGASSSASSNRPSAMPAEPVAEMPARNFESREGGQEPEASRQPSSGMAGGGTPTSATFVGRMRTGEPALASRISQLESQLRRLLACPMASLEDADQAPAGPGVLLLSDSDQVTHYYIEECQTLRIGIGNLLRGSRGSKDWGQLKQRMAENLGIAEARVSKYMKENCAVRWLQLDEGAPQLSHFAIAVLRPVVNE